MHKRATIFLDKIIDTPRLTLMPIRMDFAGEIYEKFTDKIADMLVVEHIDTLNDSVNLIQDAHNNMWYEQEIHFAVIENATNKFIGCSCLKNLKNKIPEVSFWVAEEFWGNEYGLEILNAIIVYTKENMTCSYLLYRASKLNEPAQKIPEKMGVEREPLISVIETSKKVGIMYQYLIPIIPV